MKTSRTIAVLLGTILAFFGSVRAAELFVSKQGRDTNSGRSSKAAFLTVQKGVNALKAGDTLTIAPGEYSENVVRAKLGNTRKDTIIRAEIPGTVVLRGDVPAPEFKKVEGYRFVYSASFAHEPQAVLDHAAMQILAKKPTVTELEFEPGSMFYDAAEKTLYISSADQGSPKGRLYTIIVSGESGLQLTSPTRVTIEGLTATGYYKTMARRPGSWVADYQWGIVLDQPTDCTIRDCSAFLNCGGIALNNASGCVVEDCVSHDNAESSIQYYGGDKNANNVIRDCYTYRGNGGMDSYGRLEGPILLKNNIAWGNSLDYSTKSGNESSSQFDLMEGCVALSNIRVNNLKNCIFGGKSNEYGREGKYTSDNIIFSQEKDLDEQREFADPTNMDWRLQGDSRFRRSGPGGKDRGLYPDHNYTIYFLSADGDDSNDGTSIGKAWKTLGRAAKALKPGDTLYLTRGTYTAGQSIMIGRAGAKPISIRGRGRDKVVIDGSVDLDRSANIEFERIDFADAAEASDCSAIAFKNCTFGGLRVSGTQGLRVTHGLFVGSPVLLWETSGVFLSGNIYANADGPAVVLAGKSDILYSDYNSYQNTDSCWMVGGKTLSVKNLPSGHDRYSVAMKPEITDAGGARLLMNAAIFAGRGPKGTSLGKHQEYEDGLPSLNGPFVHSVSDTTANIEWWTSRPATCEVVWGPTPAMEHTSKPMSEYRFASFSLTGLKPGQKYYFKIKSVEAASSSAIGAPSFAPEMAPLIFETSASAATPRTLYVATNGSDSNTGLTRERALRSVSRAAALANAGDTVLIADGTYNEFVRVRATGTKAKPITFKSMPGQKVVMNGVNRSLSQAMALLNKNHVRIDGIYFTRYAGPCIYICGGSDVRITRCFANGSGPGYAGPLAQVRDCRNLHVSNCLMTSGMASGLNISHCPDAVVEHNLFLSNLIYGCVITNGPDERIDFRKNIVCDSLPYKVEVQLFEIASAESFIERDNCYFLRWPDDKRKMFLFYGRGRAYTLGLGAERAKKAVEKGPIHYTELTRVSLAEFKEKVGETGSFCGDPKFTGTRGMKPGGKLWTGDPSTMFDKLLGKAGLDFPDTYATDPKAVKMGVGLQPNAFKDFWFNNKK